MKRYLTGLAVSFALAGSGACAGLGSPRMNYMLNCSGCHGQDGGGNPLSGVPTLRGALGHFLKVEGGREFLIQVPGTAQSPLSHAETAELMNWMLKAFSEQETPPGTVPFDAVEVARLRGNPLVDVPGRRAELIERMKERAISVK